MAFDIDRYRRTSGRLDLHDIGWTEVRRHPVAGEAIDSMLHMLDIETHAVISLSEPLASRACMDPVITSFLPVGVGGEMHRRGLRRVPARLRHRGRAAERASRARGPDLVTGQTLGRPR